MPKISAASPMLNLAVGDTLGSSFTMSIVLYWYILDNTPGSGSEVRHRYESDKQILAAQA